MGDIRRRTGGRLVSDVIPPGYESFREARRRAFENWSTDSNAKLLGLLVTGQLQAWRADNAGKLIPIERTYWEETKGARLCGAWRPNLEEEPDLPIFATSDLPLRFSSTGI